MIKKDYGCDPIGNGMFRMVPSGEIVSYEERVKRLPINLEQLPDGCFGRSWETLERMQGARIK